MQDPPRYGRRSKQVSDLLKPGKTGMGQILARAREFERLDRTLSTLLDPAIATLVKVAVLREHCLVLVTPSAALATRLRMDSEQLIRSLQNAGERSISQIEVRVAPIGSDPVTARRERELSTAARQSLERFAEDSGDAEIKAIIERKKNRAGDSR